VLRQPGLSPHQRSQVDAGATLCHDGLAQSFFGINAGDP
jgi:hypothetical protein